MASPMLRITPPSQEEIQRQVAESMPALDLYNPSPNWIPQQASARWFYIPPDLEGQKIDHPYLSTFDNRVKVVADGIIGIRPIYDHKKNKVLVDAQGVVGVILASRGEMGMCYLPPGDERMRTQLKAQAKATWELFRVKQAQAELDSWGEKLAAHNQNPANKGKIPPRPPKRVQDAMEFLDLHADGEMEGYAFKCVDCGYRTNESQAWSRHERTNGHALVAAPQAFKEVAPKERKAKQE